MEYSSIISEPPGELVDLTGFIKLTIFIKKVLFFGEDLKAEILIHDITKNVELDPYPIFNRMYLIKGKIFPLCSGETYIVIMLFYLVVLMDGSD